MAAAVTASRGAMYRHTGRESLVARRSVCGRVFGVSRSAFVWLQESSCRTARPGPREAIGPWGTTIAALHELAHPGRLGSESPPLGLAAGPVRVRECVLTAPMLRRAIRPRPSSAIRTTLARAQRRAHAGEDQRLGRVSAANGAVLAAAAEAGA